MSKIRSRRHWYKWYTAGSVAQPVFPGQDLTIHSICTHSNGPATGHQTLSLGEIQTSEHCFEPICHVIVPMHKANVLGKKLTKIPGNALPVEFFFGTEKEIEDVEQDEWTLSEPSVATQVLPRRFRHTRTDKVTIVEKENGWTRNEVDRFVAMSGECGQLPRLPKRLVISGVLAEKDELEYVIGHANFTFRHVGYSDRWS